MNVEALAFALMGNKGTTVQNAVQGAPMAKCSINVQNVKTLCATSATAQASALVTLTT
jgi:hypothetical protein